MTSSNPDDRLVAVPCEGANELVLLEVGTGEHLGSIPVGRDPVHATTAAGTTFVATMGDRAVTAVAPAGTVERVETGVLGPSHFGTAGTELFVSCSAGDSLAVIDPVDRRLLDRVPVGAEPHEMAVGSSGESLYVGSRRAGQVDVVSVVERSAVAAVDIGPDARVQGVALGPDGDRGYAVDQREARVVTFETEPEYTVENTAPVGGDPYDLVVTTQHVYVPGRDAGTVHVFDHDLRSVTVHDGFDRPVDVLPCDGAWWVLDAESAGLVSLAGESVETPAPGLSAIHAGDELLVSHYDDELVSLVSPTKGVVWATEVPSRPFGAVVV